MISRFGIMGHPALEKPAVSDIYCNLLGAVAQLGERDVRNVEARGSIPLSSNID